jgi:NAD(P)-dependent dehydrogenase (short-subunit alcohol dehydrogenase family)
MSTPSPNFVGRVAIVTGSGRGLGREHALLLARLGAAVVVNSTSAKTADPTVKEITDAGGKAIAFVGSVADRSVADGLVRAAIDAFGRLDIVINNAGYGAPALFEDIPEKDLWDMIHVHVGGAWNTTQAAWPYMKKQGYGRVVMITSQMMFGGATSTSYSAAKAALVGFAKSLALEGKEHGILVNTAATSGYTDGAAKAVAGDQVMNAMQAYMPAPDCAPGTCWLAHEDFKATGESFSIAGRFMARIFLAETPGFLGSRVEEWDLATVRDHWDEIIEEKGYSVPNDATEHGAQLFGKLSAGHVNLSKENIEKSWKEN